MFGATNYGITIVELRSFQNDADKIFDEQEREDLSDFISANPVFGDVIPGTGGIRKLRWRARGSGKRGGARVIYYFRDLNMPVFLLAVYAKGEKMNLTMHERELMQRVVETLVREQAARSIYRLAALRDPA
ncbi:MULTISPECIES: type II toxin-antitoxin system RelE/ParE family toxin [Bradyrhizobium]|uniref:RelE toxin of RelE / RelB toxin-antitoxin system n=2 Tax=Bradyrhizobium TaxID=374 RepID=A0ABY0QFA3_9BRAD|nr:MULTISPECIES: type II toxin-antitoxin system RelE/ParE family toxin [Bradyrhizobium]SDK14258.1 RelE toxin of RelE / RelB toxin-antitoxin system [Bradyrhizobium ottawaense]SEE50925.1 RelE toxin of RelE / RelB toxin-antitoxin system [Bradyrhizobium lablabi]